MSKIPDGVGAAWLQLAREERMVAYLCLKAKGKVKGRDLGIADRVRAALLDECEVDQANGRVTWVGGTVVLRDQDELRFLHKGIEKLVGDDGEGVDIDLAGAARTLQEKVEERLAELKAEAKRLEETASTKRLEAAPQKN